MSRARVIFSALTAVGCHGWFVQDLTGADTIAGYVGAGRLLSLMQLAFMAYECTAIVVAPAGLFVAPHKLERGVGAGRGRRRHAHREDDLPVGGEVHLAVVQEKVAEGHRSRGTLGVSDLELGPEGHQSWIHVRDGARSVRATRRG